MEATYKAILLSAKDYKENDKIVRLLTVEGGIITALMKGVKKPTAKLRFGAVPLAFCEYTLVKGTVGYVVTGCNQIEDLFSIAADYDCFTAACIMLEIADYAMGTSTNPSIFIYLLKSLRLLLCSDLNPYLISTAFVQKIIHSSGYAYSYPVQKSMPTTTMELLSMLNCFELDQNYSPMLCDVDHELVRTTCQKLIKNFQSKFDCRIKSATNLS